MNDRELLELAAKAASKDLRQYEWYQTPSNPEERGFVCYAGDATHAWNPIRDDGDALRLAVSLPHLDLQWIIAAAWQACDTLGDRLAHVRRAIVRAAAEIGRTK